MVRVIVKWKIDIKDGKVYLDIPSAASTHTFWFPKRSKNKRFSLRQILSRSIIHSAFSDPLIHVLTSSDGWNWGSIGKEELVKKFKVVLEDEN